MCMCMSGSPPSPEARAEADRRKAAQDAAIVSTKQTYRDLEKKARPFGLKDNRLPKALRQWLRRKCTDPESLLAAKDALLEYQWARYDREGDPYSDNGSRALYPRRRALSSSDPDFRSRAPGKQECFSQEQSPLFSVLPTELRLEIYRQLFGHWIVKIQTREGHFWAPLPPGAKEWRVYAGTEIVDWETGAMMEYRDSSRRVRDGDIPLNPSVVSLLRSCRRIYEEAKYTLYTGSVFRCTGEYNNTCIQLTRYLLPTQLSLIRSLHITWNIVNDWTMLPHKHPSDVLLKFPNLRNLCIIAEGGILIDWTKHRILIDSDRWTEKKHEFLSKVKTLDFIPNVDVFVPVRKEVLAEAGDDRVGSVRVHGLDEEGVMGKPVPCVCRHMPVERAIPQPWLMTEE